MSKKCMVVKNVLRSYKVAESKTSVLYANSSPDAENNILFNKKCFIIIYGFRILLVIQDVVDFGLGMLLLWCLQAFETSSFC